MFNPTRRNRNIGTENQGFGQGNKLVIPYPCAVAKHFPARLGRYTKETRAINGFEFRFIVEALHDGSYHACSVDDISRMIAAIPPGDYGELRLIVLRQPKRKEEILSPVWGRLIYSYNFENVSQPAVILEAQDYCKQLKWPKRLVLESQAELQRLSEDGHNFAEEKRYFIAPYELHNVRNTQLYRTLPHEFGHYAHYLEVVERPATRDEPYETWEQRFEQYHSIPSPEKERYAHRYADALRQRLSSNCEIPFDRL